MRKLILSILFSILYINNVYADVSFDDYEVTFEENGVVVIIGYDSLANNFLNENENTLNYYVPGTGETEVYRVKGQDTGFLGYYNYTVSRVEVEIYNDKLIQKVGSLLITVDQTYIQNSEYINDYIVEYQTYDNVSAQTYESEAKREANQSALTEYFKDNNTEVTNIQATYSELDTDGDGINDVVNANIIGLELAIDNQDGTVSVVYHNDGVSYKTTVSVEFWKKLIEKGVISEPDSSGIVIINLGNYKPTIYVKKNNVQHHSKSKADKLVDGITDTLKEIKKFSEKYGDVYVQLPIGDNIIIQYKNEHGEEYQGVLIKKSIDFNCIFFKLCYNKNKQLTIEEANKLSATKMLAEYIRR